MHTCDIHLTLNIGYGHAVLLLPCYHNNCRKQWMTKTFYGRMKITFALSHARINEQAYRMTTKPTIECVMQFLRYPTALDYIRSRIVYWRSNRYRKTSLRTQSSLWKTGNFIISVHSNKYKQNIWSQVTYIKRHVARVTHQNTNPNEVDKITTYNNNQI